MAKRTKEAVKAAPIPLGGCTWDDLWKLSYKHYTIVIWAGRGKQRRWRHCTECRAHAPDSRTLVHRGACSVPGLEEQIKEMQGVLYR